MNGLDKVFAFGFLIGMVGMLVGLKRPDLVLWGDLTARTKAKAFRTYGLITIISFALFTLVAPKESGTIEEIKKDTTTADQPPRETNVENWIERAEVVASDHDLCGTAKEVSEAWKNLKKVSREDHTLWSLAVLATAKLEQCRQKIIKVINNAVQAMFVTNREKWADTFRSEMLGSGIDVHVSLDGPFKDQVTMTDERLKRPMVDMLTRGGEIKHGSLLYNLQQLGMKRATFSDGVGWKVYYELEGSEEMKGAYKKVLGPMDLGEVLRLGAPKNVIRNSKR